MKYIEEISKVLLTNAKDDPRRTPAPKKMEERSKKMSDSAKDDKGKISFNESTTKGLGKSKRA